MAYVTNSGWIEGNAMDGMRKCIADEFASVHVFHLRANHRTSGELRRREGGNVFGQGSRAPVAISIFVKNPEAKEQGRILFHDIGDYLDREQKLDRIRGFGSIGGIAKAGGWTRIKPDIHGDWLDQREDGFEAFLKLGDKKNTTDAVCFEDYSLGVITARDAWCINPSLRALKKNIKATIRFYNEERARWGQAKKSGTAPKKIAEFLNSDRKRISWNRPLKKDAEALRPLDLDEGQFVPCMYRPFTKQWHFYGPRLNEMVYRMPRMFPNRGLQNRVIAVSGKGSRNGLSVLMSDSLVDFNMLEAGAQCFPLWLFEKPEQGDLFESESTHFGFIRRDAITAGVLANFRQKYPGESVSHEDVFHYIYGLLHLNEYRERFRNNLAKGLPRIPCVRSVADYRAFRDAGRRLGKLHVDYESVTPYSAIIDSGGQDLESVADPISFFRVVKMRHPGSGRTKDLSSVIYNHNLTIRDIPKTAWTYVVNGKSALGWVMERQSVRTDKASGIVSDANKFAVETKGDPRYPLDLFLRVVTVSMDTVKVVNSLPALELD